MSEKTVMVTATAMCSGHEVAVEVEQELSRLLFSMTGEHVDATVTVHRVPDEEESPVSAYWAEIEQLVRTEMRKIMAEEDR